MKARFLVATFFVVLSTQTRAESSLLTTKLSVAGCSQPVALTLRALSGKEEIQTGDFNEVVFRIGSRTFRFNTITPQVRLKPSLFNPPDDFSKVHGVSVDATGYFLRGRYDSGSGDRTLLFFIGLPSGSDSNPGSLLVLSFRSDCTPYQVFQSGTFGLTSFETDSSGVPVLVGRHSLSQVMAGADGAWQSGNPYATTYDPYSVYRIGPAEAPAKYSLEDSEKYNRAHYCWAGPQMSEAKAVAYNLSGRKEVECMSADRARNLIH